MEYKRWLMAYAGVNVINEGAELNNLYNTAQSWQ